MQSVLQPLGAMLREAGMTSDTIEAGCGKCGACSSLSTFERVTMTERLAYAAFPDTPILPFTANDFVYKTARAKSELEGFWHLRRRTFCEEQGLFEGVGRRRDRFGR